MKEIPDSTVTWLLEAPAPFTRYMAQRFFRPGEEWTGLLIDDPMVRSLISSLADWDREVLKQHSKPDLGMHRLCLLADIGVTNEFGPIQQIIERILNTFNENNIPLIKTLIPKAFRGSGEVEEAWILCDYPQILYSLLKMGVRNEKTLGALAFLETTVRENGSPCLASLPGFRGPGPQSDFCPIASLYALKALNQTAETRKSDAAGNARESLLNHWTERGAKKHFLFGIGTDYQKLKYPLIWYNLLHVLSVISEGEADPGDLRVRGMAEVLLGKADDELRFTPESMYRCYTGQDFSDKKRPSPTLTLAALQVLSALGYVNRQFLH